MRELNCYPSPSSEINVLFQNSRSFINVPFLNLMALITERAGRVNIRVGGNSQDTATLVDSIPGGVAMSKDKEDSSNPVSFFPQLKIATL